MYPETGALRRELYRKHTEYFEAGAKYRERAMIAANRIGKTWGVGAYEVTLHLTGQYPAWWKGRRFTKPVKVWAAGDTSKTVREIIQEKLLGQPGQHGTGMIPGDTIIKTTTKSGVADAIDTAWVRHASGGISTLVFKSYDQRRESFQGTEQDVIWLDEEPPMAIYVECLLRTMTTNGLVLATFTPLNGLSEVVLSFLPGGLLEAGVHGSKFVIFCTWDEVPHLSQNVKEELWASIPPHQRDARAKGIPALGSGAIYPVPESDLLVEPFAIPDHWPRAYALDVGWNRTAAIWGAEDRDSGTTFFYAEHYVGHAEPSENARGIRALGDWIPGVIDPAARGRSQRDGEQLIQNYRDLGLDVQAAINAREAGIYSTWQRMIGGKLKVFKSLHFWLQEFRLYRRDENGNIVKERDHLMDAMRYWVMSGRDRVRTKPLEETTPEYLARGGDSWMA